MGKKNYPTNVLKQSQELLGGLSQITPAPTISGITITSLTADIAAATALDAQIVNLEAQLNDKRNLRDTQYGSLWDKVKRSRSVIKGTYGDDSPQYDLVGGTRMSDRKPYRRKTAE